MMAPLGKNIHTAIILFFMPDQCMYVKGRCCYIDAREQVWRKVAGREIKAETRTYRQRENEHEEKKKKKKVK